MKILKFLGLLMLSAVVSIAQSIPAPPEASAAEVAAGTIGTKYVSPRRLSAAPLTTAQLNAAFGSTQGSILYRNASGWTQLTPGTSGQLLSTQGAAANPIWVTATGGAGDVNGPTLGTATDNAIVRFDGTGGKTVQNSAVTIADTTGSISINGTETATAVNTGGFKSANFGLSTASGGASYFGGSVLLNGATAAPYLQIAGSNANAVPLLYLTSGLGGGSQQQWAVYTNATGAGEFMIRDGTGSADRLTIAKTTGNVALTSTTASTGIGTGALQVAGGIYAGAASVFGADVTVTGAATTLFRSTATNNNAIAGTSITTGNGGSLQTWLVAGNASGANGEFVIRDSTSSATALTIAKSTLAATFAGAVSVSGTTATWTSGTGSPESVKTAPVGSLYTRTDGGAGTTLYIKESGSGNTGWVAK